MWKFRDQCCQKESSSFPEMATSSCSLTWGFQEIPCKTQGPDFSNSSSTRALCRPARQSAPPSPDPVMQECLLVPLRVREKQKVIFSCKILIFFELLSVAQASCWVQRPRCRSYHGEALTAMGEAGVNSRECPGFAGLRPDGQRGRRSLTQDGETSGVFRREVLQRPRQGGTLNSNQEGVHDGEGSFTGRERRVSTEGQR